MPIVSPKVYAFNSALKLIVFFSYFFHRNIFHFPHWRKELADLFLSISCSFLHFFFCCFLILFDSLNVHLTLLLRRLCLYVTVVKKQMLFLLSFPQQILHNFPSRDRRFKWLFHLVLLPFRFGLGFVLGFGFAKLSIFFGLKSQDHKRDFFLLLLFLVVRPFVLFVPQLGERRKIVIFKLSKTRFVWVAAAVVVVVYLWPCWCDQSSLCCRS